MKKKLNNRTKKFHWYDNLLKIEIVPWVTYSSYVGVLQQQDFFPTNIVLSYKTIRVNALNKTDIFDLSTKQVLHDYLQSLDWLPLQKRPFAKWFGAETLVNLRAWTLLYPKVNCKFYILDEQYII